MPNWCSNEATILGPEDKLREIVKACEQDKLLDYLVPQTPDDPDWYKNNLDNWGTKWDANIINFELLEDGKKLYISFDTAWSPPVQAFETYSEKNSDITFNVKYFEPGIGFAGEFSFDGEIFDDDCLSYEEDGDHYKEYIREHWDWEDDEYEEDE